MVPKQRAERLALAHAVEDVQRAPHAAGFEVTANASPSPCAA